MEVAAKKSNGQAAELTDLSLRDEPATTAVTATTATSTDASSSSRPLEEGSEDNSQASPQESNSEDAWEMRRKFCLPIILPGCLQNKSAAVIAPMLPIFIREDLGGSVGSVGIISSAASLASVFASVPMGLLFRKVPYSVACCSALVVNIFMALLCLGVENVGQFFICRFGAGLSRTAWDLARKIWLSAEVPPSVRGRISATIAGLNKWALMLAAALSGIVAEHVNTRAIFWIQASISTAALLLISFHFFLEGKRNQNSNFLRESRRPISEQNSTRSEQVSMSLPQVLRLHWRSLLGPGGYCGLLAGCRNTWAVAFPLAAHQQGFSKQNIGLAYAGIRAIEGFITLFFAGQISDRLGFKGVGIPGMFLMGLGFMCLPLAAAMQHTAVLLPAACFYAFGNGLLGGIILTITTATTPSNCRTEFLGLWKAVQSVGGLCLPPLFGAVADVSHSLDFSCAILAFVCFASILWLVYVDSCLPRVSSARSVLVQNSRSPEFAMQPQQT